MEKIMTVTGPIEPEKLGMTLTHEHIFCDQSREMGQGRNPLLNDIELAYEELMLYKNAGGQTLIDQTTKGLRGGVKDGATREILNEPHPLAIRNMAKRTGLNIILGTGWYRQPYYPEYINQIKTNELTDEFIRDINIGIDDTDVRAGILGEIGADTTWISPAEERVFRAVARAHTQTGVTIATHTSGMTIGLDQLDLLEEEGVNLNRVIVGHCHSYNNHEYHLEIARRGAYLQFDRMGQMEGYEPNTWLALIVKLINAGYEKQILLSHDICARNNLVGYGGNGYAYIATKLEPILNNLGVNQEQFKQLTIENPKRALTGEN
ncbi:MAG: phosphotriesterase-related protein [SAR202 cluster bacterium]|nr:phosphotriesterase-related protein [SAR202 cluster bacterium]MQG25015.1 phosphotriesterase-related protein [SAR202 cluster bacterium]|tara:strand:+ start:16756 stop:17718 length:963 start_codon:yes stop_codon:yes gene_type:complete